MAQGPARRQGIPLPFSPEVSATRWSRVTRGLGNGSHAEIRRHTGIEPDVFSPESLTILRWNEGRLEVVTPVVAGQERHPLSAQDALLS